MEDFLLNLIGQYPWLTVPVILVCVIGYAWTQIRQVLSAEKMEKLPDLLVTILEWCAGNKGYAENLIAPKPRAKQIK